MQVETSRTTNQACELANGNKCLYYRMLIRDRFAKNTRIANMTLYFIEFLLVNESFMPTEVKQQQALIQNYPVKHPATI